MEDDKTTKKPKRTKKKLDIMPRAFVDNIVFSKKEVWAYYRIENKGYDFLSLDAQAELIQRLTNSFNNLISEKSTSIEGHMIVTSVPVDVDLWREQIIQMSESWNRSPGFDKYISEMSNFLKNESYSTKVVYLGFNLGRRGALNAENLNPFEAGLDGVKEFITAWSKTALALPNSEVKKDEEIEYRRREQDIYRTLAVGALKAERATAEELLLLIKRQFYPAMPTPYLSVDHGERFGEGDLVIETDSIISNKFRWLELNQMIDDRELTGYRATLSMTRFPKELSFPGSMPFIYFVYKLGLPFTAFSRFTIHNPKKMKKELEKKKKEQRDELQNIAAGMDSTDLAMTGLPDEAAEALRDQQEMSALLAADKSAWVEGSYFVVVEAPTVDILKKYVAVIKDRYAEQDIHINWTSGDQAQLFLSQMPGDKHRMQAFDQVTTLGMLPGTGFNLSSDVGDKIVTATDVKDML
jgi:hypothetical protein